MIAPASFSKLLKNRHEGIIAGRKVYVITRKDLIEMKKSAGRAKDKIDAEELEKLTSEAKDNEY
jgi:hypothetical protein